MSVITMFITYGKRPGAIGTERGNRFPGGFLIGRGLAPDVGRGSGGASDARPGTRCYAALNSTLWTPDRSVVCLACHKS